MSFAFRAIFCLTSVIPFSGIGIMPIEIAFSKSRLQVASIKI